MEIYQSSLRGYTKEELREMSIDDLTTVLSSQVYKACRIVEDCEFAGILLGNGHHARQEMGEAVVKLFRHRLENATRRPEAESVIANLKGAE